MIRLLCLAVFAIALGGCTPRALQLTSETIESAVEANNAMVQAMAGLQERAKIRRRAAMMQAAKTVGSYAEGQRRLDEIGIQYAPVFEAFIEAERIQNALADGLELARAAVKAGQQPNVAALVELYIHLERTHANVTTILGAIP